MRLRPTILLLAAGIGGVAACADVPTTPRLAPVALHADATRIPATMRVTGRALGAVLAPDGTENERADTFRPLAGARVTLYRTTERDGQSRVETVAVRTTDASGAYAFDELPGGAYVAVLNASPTRAYGQALANVPAGASHVTADLRVWYRASTLAAGGVW